MCSDFLRTLKKNTYLGRDNLLCEANLNIFDKLNRCVDVQRKVEEKRKALLLFKLLLVYTVYIWDLPGNISIISTTIYNNYYSFFLFQLKISLIPVVKISFIT